MGTIIVAAGALIVAFCGLIATIVGLRRKTDTSYTDQLERRLRTAEDELTLCRNSRREFEHQLGVERDRNYVLALENYRMIQEQRKEGR